MIPIVCRFQEYSVFIVCFRNVLTCYKPFEEFRFLLFFSWVLLYAYIGTLQGFKFD